MKTRKPKKLSLEKFQVARLTNLSFIMGGTGDDDDPVDPQSKVIQNCQNGGQGGQGGMSELCG